MPLLLFLFQSPTMKTNSLIARLVSFGRNVPDAAKRRLRTGNATVLAGLALAFCPVGPLSGAEAPPALYPNLRAPLLETKYVRLPVDAIKARGWLRDQLIVQANGYTGRLPEVWDAIQRTAWKGDRAPWKQEGKYQFGEVTRTTTYSGSAGLNMYPECCWARFVPRWLEGLLPLAHQLDDPRLKQIVDQYLQYLLTVEKPESVTPSITAWSHLGRILPLYYEATGDKRVLELCRRMFAYFDHIRGNNLSPQPEAVQQTRLGMPLSFAWWYYSQTADPELLGQIQWIAKNCVDYYRDFYTSPRTPSQHIVDVCQAIQYPVQYYLLAKDPSYRDCVPAGMKKLDALHGQAGGRWNGDEYLSGLSPTQGSELCSVTELIYSLLRNFEAVGDLAYVDRLETLVFNCAPGTCTGDWWAHQYDQQANQVLVSVAKRKWHGNNDASNIFGFTPNYACCLSNMHSPFPNYIQHLWMATADRGLIAPAYGPSETKARVADGLAVTLTEETDYPFADGIRITVQPARAVAFPLYLRIPAWADGAEVSVAGGPVQRPAAGTLHKLDRTWQPGDVVNLSLHPRVRTEPRANGAVFVRWGALYFSLRIGQAFKPIKVNEARRAKTAAPTGVVNWHIDPTTDWNYGLAIDPARPEAEVQIRKIGRLPFARKDEPVWLPGATAFTPWTEDVPVVLKMKARQIPSWGMDGASAADITVSPVNVDTPETMVELIPYGCTRLRLSEFPLVVRAATAGKSE
jgi:hypothetical protein